MLTHAQSFPTRRRPHVAVVARDKTECWKAARALRLEETEFESISFGQLTVGKRLSRIIVAVPLSEMDERELAWFHEALRTRLVPGGLILTPYEAN